MAQQIKDPALSLLWLGLPLWHEFKSPAQGLLHAMGEAKKKKKKKKKKRFPVISGKAMIES